MKGKDCFTATEANIIRGLLREKTTVNRTDQKRVRNKLRRKGFYISDFTGSFSGFGEVDFDDLVKRGRITVAEGETLGAEAPSNVGPADERHGRKQSDEEYIIDLCDTALGMQAVRQHRFPFLVGDSGVMLPVDAYYPGLKVVVEYRERQHTEAVKLFDRRETVSGVNRSEQRRLYDQRRRDALPEHGITLVELSFDMFKHSTQKRLLRIQDYDLAVITGALKKWVKNG